MKCTILSEDADGVSFFTEGEIEMAEALFAPPAPPMPRSAPEPCTRIIHIAFPPGWTGPRHPSPRRQIAYCLSGRTRVEASNGTAITMMPGDILRMEDTEGAGHVTTSIGEVEARFVMVQLE
ncbi:cupin domain-containing protein [Fluviibacterium sp. DFM31]|uniref:Cupin domain-containing protein n=1 Tax=Meridianimarinicoccus marinus TaxID=3231483 RepID=A0ABV3L6A5_9RHOB